MKKKIFITVILCVIACCLFGCGGTVTRKKLDKQYGDGITVNFELGEGGAISGQDNVSVYYYYSRGADNKAQIVEPGKGALSNLSISKADCFLEGWYTEAEFKNKWDFNTRVENNITLYAKWLPNFRYTFYYRDEVTGEETELKTDRRDDEGNLKGFFLAVGQGGSLRESNRSRITRSGYTLLDLYKDIDCTEKWDYNFQHPGVVENGESVGTEYKVYTKWLEGDYTLVSSPSDIAGIAETSNYYLLNDIDFTEPDGNGNLYDWSGGNVEYSGTIIGNGYTIKGLKASFPVFGSRDNDFGIFKKLNSGARLQDVKFEQVEVTVDDTSSFARRIGLLCGTAERDVILDNAYISGKITFINLGNPTNCTVGFIAGDCECDISGLTALTDIDNRISGYTWHADESDTSANTVVFTQI